MPNDRSLPEGDTANVPLPNEYPETHDAYKYAPGYPQAKLPRQPATPQDRMIVPEGTSIPGTPGVDDGAKQRL